MHVNIFSGINEYRRITTRFMTAVFVKCIDATESRARDSKKISLSCREHRIERRLYEVAVFMVTRISYRTCYCSSDWIIGVDSEYQRHKRSAGRAIRVTEIRAVSVAKSLLDTKVVQSKISTIVKPAGSVFKCEVWVVQRIEVATSTAEINGNKNSTVALCDSFDTTAVYALVGWNFKKKNGTSSSAQTRVTLTSCKSRRNGS